MRAEDLVGGEVEHKLLHDWNRDRQCEVSAESRTVLSPEQRLVIGSMGVGSEPMGGGRIGRECPMRLRATSRC